LKPVALLGPQRLLPTVGDAARRLGLRGPCAIITAGWQEREAEDEELRAALGLGGPNLRLYERWERLRQEDPALARAHRDRQDRLRRLQSLYRERLGGLMSTARKLLEMEGPADLLEPERRSAISAVRALDEHHLQRVVETNLAFEDEAHPGARAAVAGQRAAIARILADCEAVIIAGGHVAVLLNRLRLFRLDSLLRDKPLIAWSAGAMALADRVVLFHDSPPQGAGWAELMDFGLGLAPDVVVLPHARRRLRLDDPVRVRLLSRRFRPAACVPLDEGDYIDRVAGTWRFGLVLGTDGGMRRAARLDGAPTGSRGLAIVDHSMPPSAAPPVTAPPAAAPPVDARPATPPDEENQ
jgi:hypothetical protein